MGVQTPPNSAAVMDRISLLADEAEQNFKEATKLIAKKQRQCGEVSSLRTEDHAV